MREALRRQLPHIQQWSVILPLAILAMIAVVVGFVWLVWFRNTPERAVRNFMEAYRTKDVGRLSHLQMKSTTPLPPTTQKQIDILAKLIADHGRIVSSESQEGEAVVKVEASFTGSNGVQQPLTVEVRTVRAGRDWVVDMEYAARQAPPQFWGEMQRLGRIEMPS